MTILNPVEYKLENVNASLDDYIDHLKAIYWELEDNLLFVESLENYSIDSVNELQEQMEKIVKICLVIEDNYNRVIVESIKSLEIEDLLPYFNQFNAEIETEERMLYHKQEELAKQMNAIENVCKEFLDIVEKQNNIFDLSENNVDTEDFFELKTKEDFFTDLIYFETFFELHIEKLFEEVLVNKCQKLDINISDEEIVIFVKRIVHLIGEYRNVVNNTSNQDRNFVENLLSHGKGSIYEILLGLLKPKEINEVLNEVFVLSKMESVFFNNLPDTLQEILCEENFNGKTFDFLNQIYRKIKYDENPPQIEKAQKDFYELFEQYENIRLEAQELTAKHNDFKRIMNNKEAMQTELIKRVSLISNTETIDELLDRICNAINASEVTSNEDINISDIEKELTYLQTKLSKASEVLNNKKSQEYFNQKVMEDNKIILTSKGLNSDENIVKPFIFTEQKRLKQIELMINTQRQLKSIHKKIHYFRGEFATLINPYNNYDVDALIEEYNDIVLECYQTMDKNKYFHINSPSIFMLGIDYKGEEPLPESTTFPNDFLELTLLKNEQLLPDLDGKYFSEETKKYFFPNGNWDEMAETIINNQVYLIQKLFDYTTDKYGNFKFSLSEADYQKLIMNQNYIISIFKKEYEVRAQAQAALKTIISEKDIEKLKSTFGLTEFTKENMEEFIDLTKARIGSLLYQLYINEDKLKEQGIELPENIFDNIDLQEFSPFKNLEIDAIKSVEDAEFYINILSDLKAYNVDSETISDFYEGMKR